MSAIPESTQQESYLQVTIRRLQRINHRVIANEAAMCEIWGRLHSEGVRDLTDDPLLRGKISKAMDYLAGADQCLVDAVHKSNRALECLRGVAKDHLEEN